MFLKARFPVGAVCFQRQFQEGKMIKFLSSAFLAALLIVSTHTVSSAQDSPPPQSQNTLEEIVVTAGRVKEEKKFITANVTVIDEREIAASSATDLGELLAQKGIGAIKKYPGTLTSIEIRGFRTETHGNDLKGHVLILLNGRRAGTGNVAKIMTKNVERIEIIRGPASVQYGSAAVGGVVNVITRQGRGKVSAFAEGYLGSFDSQEGSVGISGAAKQFDFSGTVTKGSSEDYTTGAGHLFKNSGVDSRENLSLNLGYSFLDNHRLGFMFNGFEVEGSGSPEYLSKNDLDDYSDKFNYSYDLTLDGQTRDSGFIWSARYFSGKDKDEWFDPVASNPSGWDNGIPSKKETENQGAQAQLTANIGITQITGGMDWSDYEIESSYTPKKSSYENLAGFLLGKVKLLDERLVLAGGLRYDTYEVKMTDPSGNTADDSNLTPNVGLSYLFTDFLRVRAGYSQAFVMPSADHMAADYVSGGKTYKGNPNLSPETSQTYEGGLDLFYNSFSGALTYFLTDFKDKIESVTRTNGDKSWDNVGKARVAGFEGEFGFDLGEFFAWGFEVRPYAGFTYLTDYEDRDTGKDLLETSDLTASYGISISDYKGFTTRLNFAYYGEKTIRDFETSWAGNRIKAKSFTVADLTLSKKLFSTENMGGVTLNTGINNLFDQDYAYVKGYPMPGRNFYLGLRYTY